MGNTNEQQPKPIPTQEDPEAYEFNAREFRKLFVYRVAVENHFYTDWPDSSVTDAETGTSDSVVVFLQNILQNK